MTRKMRFFTNVILPLASYLITNSNAQILSALFGSSPSTASSPPAALLPSNSASAPNVLSIPTLPTALSLPSALSLPTAITLPTLPTLPSLPSLPSLSLPISLPFPTPSIAPNAFKPNAFRPATNPLLSALGLPQLVITIQWLPPPPGDDSVEHRILTLTHIASDKVLIAIRFHIGRGLARVISGLDDLIPGLNLGDTLGRSGPRVGRRQDVATLSNLLSTTSDSGFIFGMATEIVNRMIQPVVEVTEVEVVKMYAMPVNGSDVAACGNGTSMEWVPVMENETIGAGSTLLKGSATGEPMSMPTTCNGTGIPLTVGTGSSAANVTGTSAGSSMQTIAGAASALSTASMSTGVEAASALPTGAQSGVPLSMQSGMPMGTEATMSANSQVPANTGSATPTAAGVGSDSGSGSTSGSGSGTNAASGSSGADSGSTSGLGSGTGAGAGSSGAGSSGPSSSASIADSGSGSGSGSSASGSNSGSNSGSGVNNDNDNSNGAGTPAPTPLPTAPPATPSANSIPSHLFYVMTGPATRITRTVYRVTRSGGVATSTGA